MNESPLIHRTNFLLEKLLGVGGGAASSVIVTDGAETLLINPDGSINVVIGAVALPTGASTAINQTNGTQLSRITDGTDTLLIRPNGSIDTYNNLPFGADYLALSNPDVNNNYQIITYRTGGSGGTIVKTVSLTFDGNNNVISYTEA